MHPCRNHRVAPSRVLAALICALLLLPIGLIAQQTTTVSPRDNSEVPRLPREFRGVWVATVSNLDWPSRRGLSTQQQQAELIEILDTAKALNMNAIIFQVRSEADAFYDSRLEPWSANITGTMGQAPEPYYDPLAFLIEHAHARGIEVHAWLNPYRARANKSNRATDPRHIVNARPNLVREYGNYMWMDPGHPEVQQLALDVIADILDRYDVDGIQFDDYFYPYPQRNDGQVIPFPDAQLYQRYRQQGGTLSHDDWRRKNVDDFLRRTYELIREKSPHVKFGISPFGIWRPGHPQGIRGMDPYSQLYADSRKWLREGWLDYFSPQLYWSIDSAGQGYNQLMDWWISENPKGRHIWIGNATYKIGDFRNGADEVINQVRETQRRAGSTGNIMFRFGDLRRDRDGIRGKLRNGPYARPAAIPASPWLGQTPPPAPQVRITDNEQGKLLEWRSANGEQPWQWAAYALTTNGWWIELLPGSQTSLQMRRDRATPSVIAISAIDRIGNESDRSVVRPGN